MKDKKKDILVKEDDTLLNILSKNITDISKKKIKSLIKYEMVYVNNKIITNSSKMLKKGSTITVYFRKTTIPEYKLHIIYEDSNIIVIDKPSGLLSISNDKEKNVTAFRIVSDYLKKTDKNAKLFVVHRLDMDTSGVLLFAKNLKYKKALQDNWNDLVKLREYVCAIEGKMKGKGTYTSYLTINHFQKVYSTKNKEIGKYAVTNYECLKTNGKYTLLKVDIDTGRRNQIRVHLSEHNHAIVGDKKYGSLDNPINRLALHASKLELINPFTNELMCFEASVPKEILSLV